MFSRPKVGLREIAFRPPICMLQARAAGITPQVNHEIERAIAREQERLAHLLEMTRAGQVPIAPAILDAVPELLFQISLAIDQIEDAVSKELAKGP